MIVRDVSGLIDFIQRAFDGRVKERLDRSDGSIMHAEMRVGEFALWSLEIIGYDPSTETFPSSVYSDMGGTPVPYQWNVRGDTLTHAGAGARFTDTFSEDGFLMDSQDGYLGWELICRDVDNWRSS